MNPTARLLVLISCAAASPMLARAVLAAEGQQPSPARAKPPAARRLPARSGAVTPASRPPAAAAPASDPVARVAVDSAELTGERQFNQCKKLPRGRAVVKLNLKPDTEITDLIGWISNITCTPFLTSSGVALQGKKVTVIAPEAMSSYEAYRLFYAALESVGLTVEASGKFLRIVDASKARMSRLPYYGDSSAVPADKRFVTKLLRISHVDATEMVNTLLNRLKGEFGDIVAYRGALIMTDSAENVDRMVRIVEEFDRPSAFAEKMWMVRIKNMSATEMAARLSEIVSVRQMGTGGGGRRGGAAGAAPAANVKPREWALPGDLEAEMAITKMIPEDRTNSLILVANEMAYEWVSTLIRKLDQPGGAAGGASDGKVHVYYCENANCDELAATLTAVAGVQMVGAAGGAAARRPRTSTPGQPPIPQAPGGAGGQGQDTAMLFEGDVRITFDAGTNSLLVVSSFKDFQALRRVIQKLDAPRKQIFIEAMIMEVLLDKSREVGVAYHGGKPLNFPGNDQSLVLGGFEASKTLSPTSLISNLGGLTGALFGPTIPAQNVQLFGTSVQLPSFGVFLQLLQTNNDVNVLSNPSLLITNNEEGEISVGENLPFPGQLLPGLGGLGGLPGQPGGLGGFGAIAGVQRQDVALRMKIIPSVNEHNIIRIEVDQEVSDVSAPNYNGLGPATSKRSAKTMVVARDQQTVVIGGLMTDRATETVKKIPILGDIPVLGFFFRSTSKSMKKSNIVIALTPYVINDPSDLRRVAEKKLRERREFIERYSALEDRFKQAEASIDYRRKRGMLEEINRTARELDVEDAELRQLRARDAVDDAGPIDPPLRRAGPYGGATIEPVVSPPPGREPPLPSLPPGPRRVAPSAPSASSP